MTTRTGSPLVQGERRLVLHVFDAHALGPSDEDSEGIRTLDEVLDLQPPLLGLLAVVLRRIYEATNVEEHASSVRIGRGAGEAHAVLARFHGGGVVSRGEAHLHESARGLLGRSHSQDETIEVVFRELSFARNQGEREPFGTCESVSSFAGFGPGRESRCGGLRIGHAYGYAFDLPRRGCCALRGVEQGELAQSAPCPHQGVTVRAVHDVEPKVRCQEPGGSIPIAHVECYVIQPLYLHGFSLSCCYPPRR